MFKINNKDTRTTPLVSLRCLYYELLTYFTPCSSVSIVNFEYVIAIWKVPCQTSMMKIVNSFD